MENYKTHLTFFIVLSAILFSCKPQTSHQLIPFSLHDVRLQEGMFKHAMNKNKDWLIKLDPDRLLSGFRLEAGLTPRAPKYGGWESAGVAGHTLGHYLSACAMTYASTGDIELMRRINYIISELDTCQKAFENGLLAGFPRAKELFEEVAAGDIRTKGFDLNEGWVPLYTMHKLFAGLIDVYEYMENQTAYKILVKLSDFFVTILSPLSDQQIQKILVAEHGGINESLADVYALTGNNIYMELAERMNHKEILNPLIKEIDDLTGKHANTQIPKVIGFMRQYELTGDTDYYTAANFFWNTVVYGHSYVIGGNSEAEHFGATNRTYDRITDKTCETCNTYNMLKLTRHLFEKEPAPDKLDYYERALYNHILASQNPEDGMVSYFMSLAAGSRKSYSTPYNSFWCCVGTGIENHSRYGEFIYYRNPQNDLYVNLFIPSDLHWEEEGIVVKQRTVFPDSDTVYFYLEMDKNRKFTMNLRRPSWAGQGYSVFVNGTELDMTKQKSDEYLSISRTWKNGDKISYILPMQITSEGALGDSTIRAYLYGPIVLAALLEENQVIPQVVTDNLYNAALAVEVTGPSLSFMLKNSKPKPVVMIPYYRVVNENMMVYFNHYDLQDWEDNKEYILSQQDRESWIIQQTVSDFQPGEMQPERDHNFKGVNVEVGDLHGRKYRQAVQGGWFSFDLDVLPDREMDLVCTFWGHLGDIYKFSIDVEGQSIATIIIHWWGSDFIDNIYHIPPELTKGKERVKVTFTALDENSIAGPLFNVRSIIR